MRMTDSEKVCRLMCMTRRKSRPIYTLLELPTCSLCNISLSLSLSFLHTHTHTYTVTYVISPIARDWETCFYERSETTPNFDTHTCWKYHLLKCTLVSNALQRICSARLSVPDLALPKYYLCMQITHIMLLSLSFPNFRKTLISCRPRHHSQKVLKNASIVDGVWLTSKSRIY